MGVSRRELLRSAARWAVLVAATGGVGGLIARRTAACAWSGPCRDCALLRVCVLPPARRSRGETQTEGSAPRKRRG